MNRIIASLVVLSICGVFTACNKADKASDTATNSQGAATAAVTPSPNTSKSVIDVGTVEQVPVTVSGQGITPDAAVNAALALAIKQVNGTTVRANTATLDYAAKAYAKVDVETRNRKDSATVTATLQSHEFAQSIETAAQGAITEFQVKKVTAPINEGGNYIVEIAAKVAKFKVPDSQGKLKIVIGPLKTDKTTFNIAGRATPAADVLNIIHQQIVDAVTQTGRFIVLDRQFNDDIQNELGLIASGQTNNADFAKLGNASSADIIWTGVVNDFAYEKNVRHLENSDRDLVSYAGGWSVSQRIINLTTRQVLQSSTLKGAALSTAPTTLGTSISQVDTIKSMSAEVVQKAAEAIILKIFPISIVVKEGNNVVLSQGMPTVKQGARYQIYQLGKELKDPQTGLSLGQSDTLCCEIVIDRVTDKISYGTLEKTLISLDNVAPSTLQVREMITNTPVTTAASTQTPKVKTARVTGKSDASDSKLRPNPVKKDDW